MARFRMCLLRDMHFKYLINKVLIIDYCQYLSFMFLLLITISYRFTDVLEKYAKLFFKFLKLENRIILKIMKKSNKLLLMSFFCD
jgi:hypothetical protein